MARKARKSGRIATQVERLINMENQCLGLAESAVTGEPVSGSRFPCSTGKLLEMGVFGRVYVAPGNPKSRVSALYAARFPRQRNR